MQVKYCVNDMSLPGMLKEPDLWSSSACEFLKSIPYSFTDWRLLMVKVHNSECHHEVTCLPIHRVIYSGCSFNVMLTRREKDLARVVKYEIKVEHF